MRTDTEVAKAMEKFVPLPGLVPPVMSYVGTGAPPFRVTFVPNPDDVIEVVCPSLPSPRTAGIDSSSLLEGRVVVTNLGSHPWELSFLPDKAYDTS
jgi:hypothetical protein